MKPLHTQPCYVTDCASIEARQLLDAVAQAEPDKWATCQAGGAVLFRPNLHAGSLVATLGMEGLRGRALLQWRRKGRTGSSYAALFVVPGCVGGPKAYWQCPVSGAYAAKLYLRPDGGHFASRAVHRLLYPSQVQSAAERAAHRARRLREAMGQVPAVLGAPPPDRPPGMTARTFQQATAAIQDAEGLAFATLARR